MMSASAAQRHRDLPYHECKQYLFELLRNPQDLGRLSESYTGRVISRLAFGDVKFGPEITKHSHALLDAISPAANLPNIVPQLRRLPAWMSPWKRAERARHERERLFFIELREQVAKAMAEGSDEASYMRMFLENKEKSSMEDLEGAYVVGMVGLAGILTTASALMTYVLAMCLHPQWQEKVQEEIDRVCGDRMPQPSDAPDLPVLRAVIKECMRWRPVTPSSAARSPFETRRPLLTPRPQASHTNPKPTSSTTAISSPRARTFTPVNGSTLTLIPSASPTHPLTSLFSPSRAITRDESVYPDAESFNPARWLQSGYPTYREPLTQHPTIQNFTTFGYGRRICMGMDLVEQELLVGAGGIAWALTVGEQHDPVSGRPVPIPAHDYTNLLISRPRPFGFALKARSEGREERVWRLYYEAVAAGEIAGMRTPAGDTV